MNCIIIPVLTTNSMVNSMEMSTWGIFSKCCYQYFFDEITIQSDTYPVLSHENREITPFHL